MKKADGTPARPKDENGRPHIRDGEILTACQQVCATGAISFGDIADPTSELRAWKQEPTHYGLLAEFNTMPRTGYLAAGQDAPGIDEALAALAAAPFGPLLLGGVALGLVIFGAFSMLSARWGKTIRQTA